ncbi:hypothetical protein [Antarctobacter sp.]|uniref:hypothetical protein n=1 Tax=Antarctobacter sp. TaxID=1872577 RepID=UPI002B268D15|nr:hypothetical protein [Antarctobacter sp.]
MMRLIFAGLLLLPGLVRADVTCAEMQAAMRVPPPPSGVSDDPGGPLGCSRDALQMFVLNETALAEAVSVTDLSELHGVWLGDLVLQYLLGVTVPGQEMLVFGPGKEPGTLAVTQYWMKAVAPPANSFWTEDGTYLGVAAEAMLERDKDGAFNVAQYGDAIRYGSVQLEHERSYDLAIKAQLNHFELGFDLRLAGDVLVLEGALRDPGTRDPMEYARTYTRIAPGAAELALATIATFELSQSRNFDCLTHQISDGAGPLIDAVGADGIAGLRDLILRLIANGMRRERLAEALGDIDDDAERDRLRQELGDAIESYLAITSAPEARALTTRVAHNANLFCPELP